jgi:hypothetical protein
MELGLKLDGNEMTIGAGESEFDTKTAVGIGRILTQKVIRTKKITDLMKLEVHGANFKTLKMNEVSNSMWTNVYSRKSDTFFRFVVVARADCLPTPAHLRRWYGDRGDENCRCCGKGRVQILVHILNECTPNSGLMTKRHNQLANIVRRAVETFLSKRTSNGDPRERTNRRTGSAGRNAKVATRHGIQEEP